MELPTATPALVVGIVLVASYTLTILISSIFGVGRKRRPEIVRISAAASKRANGLKITKEFDEFKQRYELRSEQVNFKVGDLGKPSLHFGHYNLTASTDKSGAKILDHEIIVEVNYSGKFRDFETCFSRSGRDLKVRYIRMTGKGGHTTELRAVGIDQQTLSEFATTGAAGSFDFKFYGAKVPDSSFTLSVVGAYCQDWAAALGKS